MKLIILDRDGVINVDSDEYIKHPDEWQPIAGSLEAIAALNHAGYHIVVASNQSGIARGLFDIDTLNAIHQKMYRELEQVGGHIDAVFFCPHGPSDGCDCRKPKPGMLLEIGERLRCDLREVYVIGDSLRDLEPAEAVGAKPLLLRTGKGAATELHPGFNPDWPVFDNLGAAVSSLLRLPNELDTTDDTA
ncbi:MAG: D-glycero-beta-D-manno-heptose 1,7-bisphosphate 7-phosphatase [Candidatus Sedimenticola sp. (ex Thyasira tokunagai)]